MFPLDFRVLQEKQYHRRMLKLKVFCSLVDLRCRVDKEYFYVQIVLLGGDIDAK